jgi:hypothetical protein
MTTNIAFGNIRKTDGNLQLAEDELDNNTLGIEEAQIVEERKTLQWLQVGMLERGLAEVVVHRDEQEQVVGGAHRDEQDETVDNSSAGLG